MLLIFRSAFFRGNFRKGPFSSIQAYHKYLRVPPRSSFKRLVIGTELYLSSRMSVPLKSPDGLKDHECEKGNLSHRPPIPYVPPTDLLPATSKIETIKIKVSDGSTVSMKIFSVGSPEEYLSHIVAVLHLIERKGLREQTKTFYGEMRNATAALQALQKRKALESKDGADDEQSEEELSEADKVELTQSQGIFKDSKSKYVKAIEATYEVMRTLLAGDPLTQWDRIVKEMHEGDSWLVQMGKNTRAAGLSAVKPFLTASSYISSRCFLPTPPKGSATTSNKGYASPSGPVYASSSRGCNS